MIRTLLSLALIACASLASARPPDELAHSPIPPLEEPVPANIKRAVPQRASPKDAPAVTKETRTSPWPISPEKPRASLGIKVPPKRSVPSREKIAEYPDAEAPEDYSNDPQVIWNSAKMQEARWFVKNYCQRAVGTSPAEGEKFLKRLSQLPADQMRGWLRRYEQRRVNIMVERSLEHMARQLMLEHAISQQEAIRQAYANVSQLKAQAAEAMRIRAEQLAAAQAGQHDDAISLDSGPAYDPMHPSFDPARRLAEDLLLGVPIEQAAAAASLPGDLPPDDPRNFERGHEGDDFDEAQSE